MKYRIQKDDRGRKYVQVKQYILWLNEADVEVRVNGEILQVHDYSNMDRKLDALQNIIMHYHERVNEVIDMPF